MEFEPRERSGKCKKHGTTTFNKAGKMPSGKAAYKCKICQKERTSKADAKKGIARAKRRSAFVELFGGECVRCGYSKSVAALHFHHRDRFKKSFQISEREMWRKTEDIMREAEKCELLCANCHYEHHHDSGTMGPKGRLN